MLFNSYIFIFLFLPLCLAGLYLFSYYKKQMPAKLWLTGFSLWFYGYFNIYYLFIMLFSMIMNFAAARLILRSRRMKNGRAKVYMLAGVVCNLALLFYFKYYDFFIGNINTVFGTSYILKHILLPLGISFFTFQQIGFIVDTYRGEVDECRPLDYALFVSFFPQLIAGPIVSQDEMMPQIRKIGLYKPDGEKFMRGTWLFTLGMVKKVLVADTFGKAVDWGYINTAALSSVDGFLVMIFYVLQLYFDFSGYCDMARGLSWMMGMDIPVNFNSPYKSATIIEFWGRWHITLSRFFQKYVYFPMGGNRKGTGRMYFNNFVVFFLSGIWHGAGWTYVVWGVTQGVQYLVTRAWQLARKKRTEIVNIRKTGRGWIHVCNVAFTFLSFCFFCIFFRSSSMKQAITMIHQIFAGGLALPAQELMAGFNLEEFWYVIKVFHLDRLPYSNLYLGILITAGTLLTVFLAPNASDVVTNVSGEKKFTVFFSAVGIGVLFLWCVLSMAGVSSFLYFNF